MKKFVALMALTLSVGSAHANLFSNEECVKVYKDNAVQLKEYADYFNEQKIDRNAFVAQVSAISTTVGARRLGCLVVEAPEVKKCVESAKALYDSIREPINLRAIIAGNQTSVKYAKDFVVKEKLHNLKCRKYN